MIGATLFGVDGALVDSNDLRRAPPGSTPSRFAAGAFPMPNSPGARAIYDGPEALARRYPHWLPA